MTGKAGKPAGFYIPARYVMAILAHCGFACVYALRVNLSVAMVAMVNSTYANEKSSAATDPECKPHGNSSHTTKDGPFEWDQNLQGVILSSFFYGYLLTQIPGGILSLKFGGKHVFGLGVLCTSVLTIVTPFAAKCSPYLLIAVRVLEGLGEGVTFPAAHTLLSVWSPPMEVTVLSSICYTGLMTGTVLSMVFSGMLADSSLAGGWPSVFYVFGGIGVLWFVVWTCVVSSRPDSHPRISSEELNFITNELEKVDVTKEKAPIPWKSILTSVPFSAICVAHVCMNWTWYTMLTSLPIYFKEVLNFKIKENALFSALPFLCAFCVQFLSSWFVDYVRSHGLISTTAIRKIVSVFGFFIPATLLVVVSFMGCSQVAAAVALMAMQVGFIGANQNGYLVNHLDIAPRFGGVLFGITNTLATIPGCVSPSVVGALTENEPTRGQWQKVLIISAVISVFGGIYYIAFGSGKVQSWAKGYEIDRSAEKESSGALTSPVDEKTPLLI